MTIISIGKDQAKEITVGTKYSMTVSGEVQSIRKISDESFEVEFNQSNVSGISTNQADKDLKVMLNEAIAATKTVTKTIKNESAKNEADHAWDEFKH